ncbi:unnamed protein product [Rotaria sordida]|uniref:Uncharacterized protein n=1 Tax=Rotaria sordida TaxID=392033 RepID=A0A815FW19_9BILA|nr:unnamed protein product [Rotaria sordida]
MLSKLNVLVNQIFHHDILLQSPMNLRQLSIKIKHSTMLEMKRLLSPMTCLTHLTLHIDYVRNDMTDGNAWIPLLKKLVVFKFLFYVSSLEKINLDSFRTQFWLVEKKWYVTYDRWSESYSSLLYTNPYCGQYWTRSSHITGRLVTESTGLEPTTCPHVNCLFIQNISQINDVPWTRFTRLDYLALEQNLNTVFEPELGKVLEVLVLEYDFARTRTRTRTRRVGTRTGTRTRRVGTRTGTRTRRVGTRTGTRTRVVSTRTRTRGSVLEGGTRAHTRWFHIKQFKTYITFSVKS